MKKEIAEILLRNGDIPPAQWLTILEERRKALNPQLDKFTLPKFGDLACIDDRKGRYSEIWRENPEVTGDYNLNDHGISYFADNGERLRDWRKPQIRYIDAYGLSKAGNWVNIRVEIGAKPANCTLETQEFAKSVTITNTTLEDMVEKAGIRHYQVWLLMLWASRDFRSKREVLYEDARRFAGEFEAMDDIFTSIITRPKTVQT